MPDDAAVRTRLRWLSSRSECRRSSSEPSTPFIGVRDLMAHGRQELRLGKVGRLGRLFGLQKRGIDQIVLKAMPDGACRGGGNLPPGADHGDAKNRDKDGDRKRTDRFER